ncbi:hypothetical protein GYMLUDRAFT_400339 [Collybiopsis luxurians FD-317 M1]|nr:hypothetical protein GYMLUDRAFT_400339 [Collybiopsis luxurians FD-317 M1]
MGKTVSYIKKRFQKKGKNVTPTGGTASIVAPDSGTALQVSSTHQPDTGPGPGNEITTPMNEALTSNQPAPETGLKGPSTNQSGVRAGDVVDTLESVLGVLKEASAPFAPLHAAVGGVIECIHIYKCLEIQRHFRIL